MRARDRARRWTRRSLRGKLTEADRDAALAPGHRDGARWTTWPTSTSWSRRSSRSWPSSRRCSPALDEICKPGAVLATTTSSLPVIELRGGHRAARGRGRAALLQPGAGHAAGRGRAHGPHRRRTTWPRRSAVCEQLGKHPVVCARPGRLHRQRAAVPVPQRRGADARGPLRDRRRHRHRDEARLRLPDGPVRAARRGRPRRLAGHPARRCTWSSASPASRRRRCSSTWSPPATSAARPAAASGSTSSRPAGCRPVRTLGR